MVLGLLLALLACPDPGDDTEIPPEDCWTPGDEDRDGRPGCGDPDCWGTGACPEICGDVGDEDGDGRADCEDDDCWGPACPEVCGRHGDEDGDGNAGCEDSDCWSSGDCPEVCGSIGDEDGDRLHGCADPDCQPCEDCTTPGDEDGNGRADCGDVACARSGECEEVCDDLRDNDGDDLIDEPPCPPWGCPAEACDGTDVDADGLLGCDDPDCWFGPREGNCINGRDDDCDGFVDCEDEDCPSHTSEDCSWTNDFDADCDGLDPSADPDCDGPTAVVEQCRNGRDDDHDGLLDCEDGECAGTAFCEEICDNHVDDDLDGATDCWDDACWGPGCKGATASRVESGTAGWGSVYGITHAYQAWPYGKAGIFRAGEVRGRVRVSDGYGGTEATCEWSVDQAAVEWRAAWRGCIGYGDCWEKEYGAIDRCDADIVTPCPTALGRFLPWGGVPDGQAVRFTNGVLLGHVGPLDYRSEAYFPAPGEPWYVAAAPPAVTRSSWTWSAEVSWGTVRGSRAAESAIFALAPGAWYYAPGASEPPERAP